MQIENRFGCRISHQTICHGYFFRVVFFPDVGDQSPVTTDTYNTEFNEIFKWEPFILVPNFFEGIEKKRRGDIGFVLHS